MSRAQSAIKGDSNPIDELRKMVSQSLSDQHSGVENALQKLEKEFSRDNIFALGIRRVIGIIRSAFEERRKDPFFELGIIAGAKAGEKQFVG